MSKTAPTADPGFPTEPHGRIPAFQRVKVTVNPDLTNVLPMELTSGDPGKIPRLARRPGASPITLVQMWIEERVRDVEACAARSPA